MEYVRDRGRFADLPLAEIVAAFAEYYPPETIGASLEQSERFEDEARCRPETLVLPAQQRELQLALERSEQPFDYLLFASITSGTTNSNGDYQRDYLLTLELLDIHTGDSQKDSAMLRKGYHKGIFGKLKHYND